MHIYVTPLSYVMYKFLSLYCVLFLWIMYLVSTTSEIIYNWRFQMFQCVYMSLSVCELLKWHIQVIDTIYVELVVFHCITYTCSELYLLELVIIPIKNRITIAHLYVKHQILIRLQVTDEVASDIVHHF